MNETNEPTEEMSSRQGGASSAVRFAVFEMTGEEKSHLATLTFSNGDDSKWSAQGAGSSDSAIARVRPTIDRFAESRRTSVGGAATPPDWRTLADMLTEDGLIVEELPAGDYQISIQIDLNSGAVVGTQDAMHPFVASDNPLGRKVVEAIANGFSKASDVLADEIDKQTANNNVEEAVLAIKREADQGPFALRPNDRLLSALARIDVSSLSAPDRRLVRDCRLLVAQRLDRFDIAGSDADALLNEEAQRLDPEQKATLKMAIAIASLRKGNRETALSIWRNLLKEPTELKPEGRGWAWRNISLSLPTDDPEARLAAKLSADAFLEAGNKQEAGKSLMRLANILLKEEPADAVVTLDEMIAVLDKEGLTNRHVRGAALHARANRFAMLHKHPDALRDASEAAELQRGLIGAEAQFISSLHLAAIEACHVGATDKAEVLEAEAEKLTNELQIPHFQLAQRASALATAFDPKVAEELLRDAEAAKNLEVIAAVRVFQATGDPSLTDTERLPPGPLTDSGRRGARCALVSIRGGRRHFVASITR
jgi:tetratricopeptide (TPR) repeat protein